jgi:hypothetical protein
MLLLTACAPAPAPLLPVPGSLIGLGLLFTYPALDPDPFQTPEPSRAGEPMGLALIFTRTS